MNDCGGYLYCIKINFTSWFYKKKWTHILWTCADANLKIALLSAGLAVKYFPVVDWEGENLSFSIYLVLSSFEISIIRFQFLEIGTN